MFKAKLVSPLPNMAHDPQKGRLAAEDKVFFLPTGDVSSGIQSLTKSLIA